MKIAPAIELTKKERDTLKRLSRGKKVSVRLAERSTIVLLTAEGNESIAIAARLKITRQKVARWRDRYAKQGFKGIEMDAPRSGWTHPPNLRAHKGAGDPKDPGAKADSSHPVESQHDGGGQRDA